MGEFRIKDSDGFRGHITFLNGEITGADIEIPCTVRAKRAAMTDDEFWEDVFPSQHDQEALELDECFGISAPTPCPECGSTVACGYDFEGRPMIHVVEDEQ